MNERIKQVRKYLRLTQLEFGAAIGIRGNTVTSYETGTRTPSETVIRLICDKYNVNRHWLDTGEGKMFVPEVEDDEIIDEFFSSGTRESKIAAAMFREILRMPNGWEELAKAVKRMAAALDEIDNE